MPNQKVQFTIDLAPLKELEREITSMETFLAQRSKIMARAARAVTPLARQLLMNNASRAVNLNHVKTKGDTTRHLKEMLENVQVKATKYGLWLQYAGGKSGFTDHDFEKANALQFGALRGSSLRTQKYRAKLKQVMQASGKRSGGTTTTTPHLFYMVNAGDVLRLKSAMEAAIAAQLVGRAKALNRGAT
jgi:hypothetical protein